MNPEMLLTGYDIIILRIIRHTGKKKVFIQCDENSVKSNRKGKYYHEDNLEKGMGLFLSALMGLSLFAAPVMADGTDAVLNKPYVSLGADLDTEQRAVVLSLLGITEEELQDYTVVNITNEEEHQYLDAYLDYSLIGDQALSSALVVGKENGYGIQVTTQNISYCTIGMYQNALATAGIENADIKVAGPSKISGTAALIGVMKAYSEMTGEPLQAENVEAATQELVTTSQIGDVLGDTDQAENLIAAIKEAIVSSDIKDPEKIREVIEKAASELNITLTEEQIQQIINLMEKIANLDLDIDKIKSQLQGIYEKLDKLDLNLTKEDVQGFFAKVGNWLSNMWDKITDWFGSFFS